MSSDDLTKQVSTEDKIDLLIALAQQVAGDVKALSGRVDSLEQKVDARLHDTRPIWEGVQVRLTSIESEIGSLRTEAQAGFKKIDRRLDVLNGEIIDLKDNHPNLRIPR